MKYRQGEVLVLLFCALSPYAHAELPASTEPPSVTASTRGSDSSVERRFSETRITPFQPNPTFLAAKAADLNGDGRDDIVVWERAHGRLRVALASGDQTFRDTPWLANGVPVTLDWQHTVFADLDGDHCDDLFGPDGESGWWIVARSNCTSALNLASRPRLFPEKISLLSVHPAPGDHGISGLFLEVQGAGSARWIRVVEIVSERLTATETKIDLAPGTRLLGISSLREGTPPELTFFVTRVSPQARDAQVSIGNGRWADFPGSVAGAWEQAFLGDFDGDHRIDALAYHSGFLGWWIAVSDGSSGFEQPIIGGRGMSEPLSDGAIGDFDGDGRDSLLLSEPASGTYRMLDLPPGSLQNARELAREGPGICLGYAPDHGMLSKWGRTIECPVGYAVFETTSVRKRGVPIDEAPEVAFTCCKLPADDVLLGETVPAVTECPAESIVTGRRAACPGCAQKLKCTKINVAKYRLGEGEPGVGWGTQRWPHHRNVRFQRLDFPPAFRTAVGRLSYATWDRTGCVGSTFGRVLTGIGFGCAESKFRELRRAPASPAPKGDGGDGNGAHEEPVSLFPPCRRLRSAFDPAAPCDL